LKTRALICYLLITIILISGLEVYLSLFLKRYYISRLKEELFIQAELVKDLLPEKKELDTFCKRYKEITGARITVIDPAGRVLGDSEQSALKMENHLDRPEIKEAMFSGRGSSVRFSNTIKKDFLYVALLYKGLFIRLSRPLDTVNSEISRIRMPVMLSTLLALILVVLIWSYQSKRLRREIGEIIEFADKVAAGNSGSLFIENEGELSRLGARISYMAGELQKRLEEAKREKQTVEGVLKNMKEGLLIVDEKGSVLLMNESLRKLLGVTTVKEGMTAAELLRNAEIISLIEESRQLNDTISREISLPAVSGRDELYLSVTASPVELSTVTFATKENRRGIIITFYDITRLKRLEQVRRDFVANVAHEIKTPITAIKGFAETLLDGAINDRESAIRFLEIIKKHSERLNSLVSDLLTLSAIEQGEIKLEMAEVNISELIDSLFALIEKKAQAKGLYLKKIIPEEVPLIRADRDRLFQILLNLLDNAIKFTDTGGVTAGVEKAGDKIVLYVEDTGCGIEKKHLSRLGERFYRVDRSRSRELGGTGLGLAIVKHLVKAHGWEMDIESTPNVGTKVKIGIRLQPALSDRTNESL